MVLEEVCGMHEQIDVDLEAVVEEERILFRMSIDCDLRVWEACADGGVSLSAEVLNGQ